MGMAALPPSDDPLSMLVWINEQYRRLDKLRREALFDARLQGQFDEALVISGLSRKRGLAETRHENEANGRMIRWSAGAPAPR